MPYTNNIPFAAQRFKDSEPLIRDNFVEIQNALVVNHGDFGIPNVGKHLFLQMPVQGAGPVTNATEMGLYTKTGITTNPEMFIRRESNGAEIEFTGALAANTGWTRLPSGILLKWGRLAVAATPQTIIYPAAGTIPIFNNVFSVRFSFETSNINVTAYATMFNVAFDRFSLAITPTGGVVTVLTTHYLAIGN